MQLCLSTFSPCLMLMLQRIIICRSLLIFVFMHLDATTSSHDGVPKIISPPLSYFNLKKYILRQPEKRESILDYWPMLEFIIDEIWKLSIVFRLLICNMGDFLFRSSKNYWITNPRNTHEMLVCCLSESEIFSRNSLLTSGTEVVDTIV